MKARHPQQKHTTSHPWCTLKEEKLSKEKLLCMRPSSNQKSFPRELNTCQIKLLRATEDFFELI